MADIDTENKESETKEKNSDPRDMISRKFRIAPNKEQQDFLQKCIHCNHLIWNKFCRYSDILYFIYGKTDDGQKRKELLKEKKKALKDATNVKEKEKIEASYEKLLKPYSFSSWRKKEGFNFTKNSKTQEGIYYFSWIKNAVDIPFGYGEDYFKDYVYRKGKKKGQTIPFQYVLNDLLEIPYLQNNVIPTRNITLVYDKFDIACREFSKRPEVGLPKRKSINFDSRYNRGVVGSAYFQRDPQEKTNESKNPFIDYEKKRIKIPNIGFVRFYDNNDKIMPENWKYNFSVNRTPTGKFYANILFSYGKPQFTNYNKNVKGLGIDIHLRKGYIDSEGNSGDEDFFKRILQMTIEIGRLQRRLDKKIARNKLRMARENDEDIKKIKNKDAKSTRYYSLQNAIAKRHEQIVNMRNNYWEKIALDLVRKYDYICIEDLSINEMKKRRAYEPKYGKWFGIISPGKFFNALQRKAYDNGCTLIKAEKYFPSTKTCSQCDHVIDKLSVSIREWECPNCGHTHDRDINAAINLKNYGRAHYEEEYSKQQEEWEKKNKEIHEYYLKKRSVTA